MDAPPIKVLIVDDSLFVRRALSRLVAPFGMVSEASNGVEALASIRASRPDVVLLDIEMPVMDGLETLRHIMAENPLPVVAISGTTRYGAGLTLNCLEMGAVDFLVKPSGDAKDSIASMSDTIQKTLLLAANARVRPRRSQSVGQAGATAASRSEYSVIAAKRVVAIAASTGGPPAVHEVLTHLPSTLRAAVLVVQHMPPVFTAAMAQRLDTHCALAVQEAKQDDVVSEGTVLIAPGGLHMRVGENRHISLSDAPSLWGVRPAADYLFEDVARVYGRSVLGVVLTGMGCDGAQGLGAIRLRGGATVAQDEETSLIFGMPRAAIAAGIVDRVLPLADIANEIERWCQG